MSSKINGIDGGAASQGAGRVSPRSTVDSGGAPVDTAAAPLESVHITDVASQLAALEQAVQSLPALDSSRVATLRTAIEQGTYTVSPDHIADHLMQLEQSLESLGRRK